MFCAFSINNKYINCFYLILCLIYLLLLLLRENCYNIVFSSSRAAVVKPIFGVRLYYKLFGKC